MKVLLLIRVQYQKNEVNNLKHSCNRTLDVFARQLMEVANDRLRISQMIPQYFNVIIVCHNPFILSVYCVKACCESSHRRRCVKPFNSYLICESDSLS